MLSPLDARVTGVYAAFRVSTSLFFGVMKAAVVFNFPPRQSTSGGLGNCSVIIAVRVAIIAIFAILLALCLCFVCLLECVGLRTENAVCRTMNAMGCSFLPIKRPLHIFHSRRNPGEFSDLALLAVIPELFA